MAPLSTNRGMHTHCINFVLFVFSHQYNLILLYRPYWYLTQFILPNLRSGIIGGHHLILILFQWKSSLNNKADGKFSVKNMEFYFALVCPFLFYPGFCGVFFFHIRSQSLITDTHTHTHTTLMHKPYHITGPHRRWRQK